MSLPSAWVDRLFQQLTVTYGQRFLGLYAGINLDAVKADWAEKLAGFENNPKAIAHALSVLPADKAPNALEFRNACRNAPELAQRALPGPNGTKPNPVVLKRVSGALKGSASLDPKAWAHKLAEREAGGASLTRAQREMWRDALGLERSAKPSEVLEAA